MYVHLEAKLIVDISRIYDLSDGGFIIELTTRFTLNWSAAIGAFSLFFMQYGTNGVMQMLAAEICLLWLWISAGFLISSRYIGRADSHLNVCGLADNHSKG